MGRLGALIPRSMEQTPQNSTAEGILRTSEEAKQEVTQNQQYFSYIQQTIEPNHPRSPGDRPRHGCQGLQEFLLRHVHL